MEGDTIFALVNMWNMPGIENHWRNACETQQEKEMLNPVGDMDIEDYMTDA